MAMRCAAGMVAHKAVVKALIDSTVWVALSTISCTTLTHLFISDYIEGGSVKQNVVNHVVFAVIRDDIVVCI